MNPTGTQPFPKQNTLKQVIGLMAFIGLLLRAANVAGGEVSMTEYEVKSLFLVNFAKYVDWPPASFAETNTPIIIGLYGDGDDTFGNALKKVVEGKTVSGRRIIIQPFVKDDDAGKCHILFIGDSNRKRLGEILARLKTKPVLTVGETDQFLEKGGVINFVIKADMVRLQINLDVARQANLQISSKLLSVADVVKGKLK